MDETKCRGCRQSLTGGDERVVNVQIGMLTRTGRWPVKDPSKGLWGRMHERCFLVAVGDPKGIELTATFAPTA